jgi:methyl-accepting chemotaxis protein
MKQNSIFRDELPGEKKSIINLLMTGYIVVISCLGYAAFFLYIQLSQIERIVGTMDTKNLAPDQMELLKSRVVRSAGQLKNEMIGMAIVGSLVSVIGGFYTVSMIIKPLKKLVLFAEKRGTTELPEIKSNTEIKQLATAITELTESLNQTASAEKEQPQPSQKSL